MKRTHIMVHHSATADGQTVSWDDIERYHTQTRGWRDIGYHYGVEAANGTIVALVGRPEFAEAAACKVDDWNKKAIHVCCVGDYAFVPPDEDMLRVLVRRILIPVMMRHGIPVKNIVAHRDGDHTTICPGNHFDMNVVRGLVGEAWPIGL